MTPVLRYLLSSLGGDNNLGAIVSKYEPPQVNCYGQLDPDIEKSCQIILDNMPASQIKQTFALDPDPRSGTRKLPYRYTSGESHHFGCEACRQRSLTARLPADHKCSLTLFMSGSSDFERWERIWEDASVTTAMCSTYFGLKSAPSILFLELQDKC